MNQITTRYVTENGACYEQYVITDAEAKTELVITPERGGMITGFSLNGEEYIWTRHPNFSECNRPRFGVPVLFPNCGLPDNGVHIFDGKAYPMENHGFADLCAWDVESVGPDGVTLILESTPLTKFLYPFDFTVLMNYNLEGNTAAINMTVGIIVGALWGYSKRADKFMLELYNVVGNIPYQLLCSVLVLIFRPKFWTMVFALTITGWLPIAHFFRTQVLIIRDREYNLASRCLGTPTMRIATKNLLPFLTSIIVTQAAVEIPSYIGMEVFLAFIGLGLTDTTLGKLITNAQSAMLTPGWQMEFWSPVILASIIAIVLYVAGQNLGDASDPRSHMM